jgi:hypothetical protein
LAKDISPSFPSRSSRDVFRVLALSGGAAYAENAVKQPFINVEKEPKSFHTHPKAV